MLNKQIYITLMIMFVIELVLCLINLISSLTQIGSLIVWIPFLYLIYRAASEAKQGTPLGKTLTLICTLIFIVSGVIAISFTGYQGMHVMFWKVLLNFIAGGVLLYYLIYWQHLKDIKHMSVYDKEKAQFPQS